VSKQKSLLLLVAFPLLLSVGLLSFVSAQEESVIPTWLKTSIGFWVDGQIPDEEFIVLIEYFVENEIIEVPTQRMDENILINNLQVFQVETNMKIEKLSKLGDLPQIQQTLAESNTIFSKTGNPEEVIRQIDERWQSSDPDVPDSISFNLMHNPSSDILHSVMDMDRKSESKFKIAEIFVTNAYGANVAQSGKTSDFRQDDEMWWQKAKQNGLFLSEGGFDESAGVYASDIAIKILDEDGHFIGVLKAVIDIESILDDSS
jgi:hypothetical protein